MARGDGRDTKRSMGQQLGLERPTDRLPPPGGVSDKCTTTTDEPYRTKQLV